MLKTSDRDSQFFKCCSYGCTYKKEKDCAPLLPDCGNVEERDAVLLVGAYPRHEQPLLNLRLRKAALKGSKVMTIDSHARDFNFAIYI